MVLSLTATLISWIEMVMVTVGIPGLMALMTVESLGIPPLPSEVILPFAGVLIAEGVPGAFGVPFTWVTVLSASLGGGLIGALGGYYLGRRFGMPVLRLVGRRVWLKEEDMVRAENFFAKRGEETVLLARMLPILRAYISYPAGAAKMHPAKFALFTVVGSTPFTVAFVYAGWVLGKNFSALDPYFTLLDVIGGTVIAILVIYFVWKRFPRRGGKEADH